MRPANGPLTAEHLARKAIVYVRQSSELQVRQHTERRKLQYALRDHARRLGFRDVEVIDEDLGTSGSGVRRPGFDRLLSAVCRGKVGAVLSLEASRLARNGRDWHTLLHFCGIVGCLVGDRQRLYDPSNTQDRLFLGMQGSFSEAELSLFRHRSLESRRELARRGKHFSVLPAGYEKVTRHKIEMTPDQRQRDAIRLVFHRFAVLRTVRQTWLWLQKEGVRIPVRRRGRDIVWQVPTQNNVRSMLTNPLYGGAYVWGRRRQETLIEDGRQRVRGGILKPREEWTVLLLDRHEGYISWEEYERNQELMRQNQAAVRGAPRQGRALLAGLLRCGSCGRRMEVRHNGKSVGYRCRGSAEGNGGACLYFGAVRADRAIAAEVLQALQPLGVEASLQAWEGRGEKARARERAARSSLEEARYRAAHAQAQFDAVDPRNGNLVPHLAERWDRALAEERACEERLAELRRARRERELEAPQREAYLHLGRDLERAWGHRRATPVLRKAVLRTVVEEVQAQREGEWIRLLLHWKGGDHTRVQVRRMKTGQHRWRTAKSTVALVRELARCLADPGIAMLLNRLGKRTGKGNRWNRLRVRSLRNAHGIAVYREGEREERGELVLQAAAERLGVDPSRVRKLIRSGLLPARQACQGAPWLILERDLDSPQLREQLAAGTALPEDDRQGTLDFD